MMSESMVKMRLKIPRELYNDVMTQAKIKFQSIDQEVLQMLAYSLEHNAAVMSHDRLLRLIYADSLARVVE